MFNKSLFVACAATLALGFNGVAHAQTAPEKITASGTFSLDQSQFISVDAHLPLTKPGHVDITGLSGALSINVGAQLQKTTFDTVTVSGAPYAHAHLTTKRFYFINLTTGKKTLATAEVDLTTFGAHGTICFQIVSVEKGTLGAVLALTCDASGNLTTLPLSSGSTVINP